VSQRHRKQLRFPLTSAEGSYRARTRTDGYEPRPWGASRFPAFGERDHHRYQLRSVRYLLVTGNSIHSFIIYQIYVSLCQSGVYHSECQCGRATICGASIHLSRPAPVPINFFRDVQTGPLGVLTSTPGHIPECSQLMTETPCPQSRSEQTSPCWWYCVFCTWLAFGTS
jgi:hypothetical protein